MFVHSDILVPTDGTRESQAAVDEGVTIASSLGANVHFLHVVDMGTETSASASGPIADNLTESLEKEANDALDAAEEQARDANVSYERVILEGVPEDAIVEYSADHEINLIVIGKSDSSGLADQLLGTTTDHVLESANVSVLVAQP